MQETQSSLRKKRKVFGWLFIVSSFVFIVPDMLGQLFHHSAMQGAVLTQKIDNLLNRFQYSSHLFLVFNMTVISGLLTLLTLVTSFIGFIWSCIAVSQYDKQTELFKREESQKLESILSSLELELDQRRRG